MFDFPDVPELQIGLLGGWPANGLTDLYHTKLAQFRKELQAEAWRPGLSVVWGINPADVRTDPTDRSHRVGVWWSESGLTEFRLEGHSARHWRQLRREVLTHLRGEGFLA